MDQNTIQEPSLFDTEMDADIRYSLNEVSRTSRFMGIVAIVSLSLFLLFFISFGVKIAAAFSSVFQNLDKDGAGPIFLVAIIVFFAVCSTLVYFLMKGSNLIKAGLATNNQDLLNEGLNAFRIYFIIYGLVSIVTLLFSITRYF